MHLYVTSHICVPYLPSYRVLRIIFKHYVVVEKFHECVTSHISTYIIYRARRATAILEHHRLALTVYLHSKPVLLKITYIANGPVPFLLFLCIVFLVCFFFYFLCIDKMHCQKRCGHCCICYRYDR